MSLTNDAVRQACSIARADILHRVAQPGAGGFAKKQAENRAELLTKLELDDSLLVDFANAIRKATR